MSETQPDAYALSQSVRIAIQQRDDEIERLKEREWPDVEAYENKIERLRAAILDFFVCDKRETRTALRDLVGGFAGVKAHRKALSPTQEPMPAPSISEPVDAYCGEGDD